MIGRTDVRTAPTAAISRRAWLAAAVMGGWATRLRADEPKAEDRDREEVEARGREAGLGPITFTETEHYLGIGDAPDDFRERALKICETLTTDYLVHFQFKKFVVERPAHRLTLVTLADADSYAKFTGEPAPIGVGGHYNLETNRLVLFDNRKNGGSSLAARANLVALAHEATHQLTCNTGLLDRVSDVPLAISEGLATYAEVRSPVGSTKLGQLNRGRIDGLALAVREGVPWAPVDRLLTDDSLFRDEVEPAVNQLAYAESWLLTASLMHEADPAPYRGYLAALRDRRDPSHRLEDARTHLGDLDRLDQTLRRLGGQLLRGAGIP